MELGLRGKNALITGGSHGIGREIALGLAREGCNIAICSRSLDRLNETAKLIKKYTKNVILVQVDVLEKGAANRIFGDVKTHWSGVDILVNNVGGGGRWGKEDVLSRKLENVLW